MLPFYKSTSSWRKEKPALHVQILNKRKKKGILLPAPKMRSNMDTRQVAHRSTLGALQRRNLCKQKRKNRDNKLNRSIKKIRADMVEISEGQKRIREGQMEVREKFQEISKEAAKLKEETSQICKQSAANQLRLDLMFQIVKARAENDVAKDELLTQTLRDLMAKQNMSKNQGLKEEH